MRATPVCLASVAVATALLAGCGHSTGAVAEPAGGGVEPRAKVQFVRIPDAEAAHVLDPHAYNGMPFCQRCHVAGEERLAVDPIALCSQCHDPKRMKHPVRVAQPSGAEGLPLMPGRLIACHTCHEPHDVKKYRGGLRGEYVALCKRCHAGHE